MVTLTSHADWKAPQGVAAMPRNTRPACRGTGGRHAAESVAGISRNTHNGAPESSDLEGWSGWQLTGSAGPFGAQADSSSGGSVAIGPSVGAGLAAVKCNTFSLMAIGHMAGGLFGRVTQPDSYHLALYLDPDDECCQGIWPVTLGGQPDDGFLVSRPNYPGDALSNATFQQVIPTPPGMTGCEFIKRLISVAGAYDNGTPYSFPNISSMPGRSDGQMPLGACNSNSYVSGVLTAAGAQVPALGLPNNVQTPGYGNPLPIPITPRIPVPTRIPAPFSMPTPR